MIKQDIPLKIVVCIKQVTDPDYFSKLTLDPETGRIQREKVPAIFNPLDKNALEEGLKVRERFSSKVTAISMGPPKAKEVLEWALALGADEAILLCDKAFAGADSLATAYTLAAAIKRLDQPDLILCGNETADGSTAQVGPQIAELLGIPHVDSVNQIEFVNEKTLVVKQAIEYGHLKVEVKLPALLSVIDEINEPRAPTAEGIISVPQKEFKTWGATDIKVDKDKTGLNGSPTKVVGVFRQELDRKREILQCPTEEMAARVVKKLQQEGLL
jgi:electron transfer flavoprotein beta subunit